MTPLDVAARIDSIASVDDVAELQELEDAYRSLAPSTMTPQIYRSVLALFERFPDDDAYELFRSFLHLLEKCRECEPLLVESVQRRPSLITISMVDRLLNGGYHRIGSVDLRALLGEALVNPQTSFENRRLIAESIERHASNHT